ncbi:MAG: hypothetical protein JNM98_11635 [Rhodocyclaceae bacterium]|nr:hypothetical protein [Rhodocyclaceae bacterium]
MNAPHSAFMRFTARLLLLVLLNPAALAPAWARDTDIYLATPTNGAYAEPAILILLDTSDSMNAPDGWTEYPGDYNSHIEYLWNDLRVIGNSNDNDATPLSSGYQYTQAQGGFVSPDSSANANVITVPGSNNALDATIVEITLSSSLGLEAGDLVTIKDLNQVGTPPDNQVAIVQNFLKAINSSHIVRKVSPTNKFQIWITPGITTTAASGTNGWGPYVNWASAHIAREVIALDALPISSISASGTAVTATTTVSHNLSVGNTVTIYNVADSRYNGTFTVSALPASNSSTQFQYSVTNAPAAGSATAATGTVMYATPSDRSPLAKAGYWAGTTPEARIALWRAARNYARGTDSLDSSISNGSITPSVHGVQIGFNSRHVWRNYNDLSWIYWLPGGTSENDDRLRSTSYNRWRGWKRESGDADGNPQIRANLTWTNGTDFSSRNKCAAAQSALIPSTIFAPSNTPANAGKYLGHKWLRWNRWLSLTGVNIDGGPARSRYPGINRNGNASIVSTSNVALTRRTGTLGLAGDNDFTENPSPARDGTSYREAGTGGNGATGDHGQPIRIQNNSSGANQSTAGWAGLKADHGGFVHRRMTTQIATAIADTNSNGTVTSGSNADAILAQWRATYGYSNINVGESSQTSLTQFIVSNELFNAWHGNRANNQAPAFGLETGTDAYYDITAQLATGTGGITCTQCVLQGTNNLYRDALSQAMYYGGSCVTATTSGSCAFATLFSTFYLDKYSGCTFSGNPQGTPEQRTAFGNFYNANQCGGGTWSHVSTPLVPGASPSQSTASCTPGDSFQIGSDTYYRSCNPPADNISSCQSQLGGACNDNNCPSTQNCITSSTTTYTVYTLQAFEDSLVHDCESSDTSAHHLRQTQTFNTAWGTTDSYISDSGQGVDWASVPASDMYSVNYLNWKFGPKGPTGAPIGRKTRLQIAKDALTNLVTTANGVRFGLEVFNKQRSIAAGGGTDGGNIAYAIRPMGTKVCTAMGVSTPGTMLAASNVVTVQSTLGFSISDTIIVPGAASGGGNLTTTITAIDTTQRQFQVSNASSTAVTNVSIQIPVCAGSATDTYPASSSDWAQFNNRRGLIDKINSIVAASQTPLTESLYEAFLYFSGGTPKFGTNSGAAAAGGTETDIRDTQAICSSAQANTDCLVANNYRSPMLSNPSIANPASCQKNYVVLITDGGPDDDGNADQYFTPATSASVLAQQLNGATISPNTTKDTSSNTSPETTTGQQELAGVPYGPTDLSTGRYVWLDELAYYMYRTDISPGPADPNGVSARTDLISGTQPIVTHTIGFGGANPPVLKNAAEKGGGLNFVAQDSGSLATALSEVLAAIREWTPVLASPTVPASAYSRAATSSDVFMGFFAPTNAQAWSGTLKKFKFGHGQSVCGTSPFDRDAQGNQKPIDVCVIGQNQVDGGLIGSSVYNIEKVTTDINNTLISTINDQSSSFWIAGGLGDGGNPQRGGTGYQLLHSSSIRPDNRKVYTFISGSTGVNLSTDGAAQVTEANTAITKTRLGNASMNDAQRSSLINYLRGGNTGNSACIDATDSTACTVWRDWPHAGIIHSSPRIVAYDGRPRDGTTGLSACQGSASASEDARKQWVYYLTHDGMLHAVDTCDGSEQWTFFVEEALGSAQALMNNVAGPLVEVADGPITILSNDVNRDGVIDSTQGDFVYLYFGMHRGGRGYYALDVTVPDQPKLMWRISNNAICLGATCSSSSDYAELGFTFSALQPAKLVKLTADTSTATYTLALIGGGGYDLNQDAATVSSQDTMGRALFVINARTGALIRKLANGVPSASGGTLAGVDWSIPSDVSVLNSDQDGQALTDRLYVGDMAGNLWRFDVGASDPATWKGKQLAALSSSSSLTANSPQRKIFFPPVAVKLQFKGQRYDGVFVGSGDIQHPTKVMTDSDPRNALFMIKDFGTGTSASTDTTVFGTSDLVDVTTTDTVSQFNTAVTDTAWATKGGWAFYLGTSEIVTGAPSVFFNVLRFGTYKTDEQANQCQPPGLSKLYGLDATFGGLINNTGTGNPANARTFAGFSGQGFIKEGTAVLGQDSIGTGAGGSAAAAGIDCTKGAKLSVLYNTGSGVQRQAGASVPIPCGVKSFWYREAHH